MVEKQFKDIYSFGVACIFLSTFFSLFFGIGSYLIYSKAGNNSYIAIMIGSVISLLFFYMFYYIFSKNFKENIYRLNEELFKGFCSKILNLLLFVTFFIIASLILYNVSNFLNIEYLPRANIDLIKALILVSLVYISSKSLPEIIRVNQVFSIISVVTIFLDIIGLYYKFDITNVEPFFSSSVKDMIGAIMYYIAFSVIPFTLLLITSNNRVKDNKNSKKAIFRAVVFTNIMLVIISLITILVLGKEYLSAFRFPEYTALKQFSLFNMIERVENILALQFYFNSYTLLSLIFYLLKEFLPKTSITKYYSVIIGIILYIITNIFFIDGVAFTNLVDKYIIYVIFIGLIVPNTFTFIKLKNIKKTEKTTKKY